MLRARPGLLKALRLNTIGKSQAGYKLLESVFHKLLS